MSHSPASSPAHRRTGSLTSCLASISTVLLLLTGPAIAAEPVVEGTGALHAVKADGTPLGSCPLQHTTVNAQLSGFVARVLVTQTFANPFKDPIEAIYTFPLSERAAVDAMWIRTADRVIRGEIKEREEARKIYEDARAAGKLAVAFDLEGGVPLCDRPEMVQLFYDLGVRQIHLAYNRNNSIGGGCYDDDVPLSPLGRRIVAAINDAGMLMDCSHTGYRTSMDIMRVSRAPVIFSHANPLALAANGRNIRDDQIKACAATGGVVAVTGVGRFLGPRGPTIDHLVEHIDHMVLLIGSAHVGVGMDSVLDGFPISGLLAEHRDFWPLRQYPDGGLGIVPPEDFPRLTEALLARGYADADVRGILGGNYLRVADAVWR